MKKAWTLTTEDVDRMAIGFGILGTGGGGKTFHEALRLKSIIKAGHFARIIDPRDLAPDTTVLAIGAIGAPTILVERLMSGNEGPRLVEAMQTAMGRKVDAIASDEIGGSNGLAPLVTAAQLGLPFIDGDGMGRAFPETQMTSFFVGGQNTTPAALTDVAGNVVLLTDITTPTELERLTRAIAISMGCAAFMATAPMSGSFITQHCVPKTVTLGWQLGDAVLRAQSKKLDPIEELCAVGGGQALIRGKVLDVERSLTGGFNRGHVHVQEHSATRTIKIDIQNEFIVAWEGDTPVTMVPDLICIVDEETGLPVFTEDLKYGQRVAVVALPASSKLTSRRALEVMGPRAFGYDFDFIPVSKDIRPT